MTDNIFTLFSSDSTVQYTKDIFSTLSMPRESIFQFRYQAQHVENSVKAMFSDFATAKGKRALLAFRSSSVERDNIFIIPVRWVEIIDVKMVSDIYNIYFKLGGYPSFSQNFRKICTDFQKLNEYAKSYFISHDTVIALQPTPLDAVDLMEDDADRDYINWRSIVEVIVTVPQYKNYHFLKCSGIYTNVIQPTGNSEKIYNPMQNDGKTVLVEGRCVYIDIEYYSQNYTPTLRRQIEVFLDESHIRKAKGLRAYLDSRYGSITLGFQVQKSINNTITEIVICTASEPTDVIQTNVALPMIIRKNRTYKIIKSLIMGTGAALVALPGLLGSSVAMGWNIGSALLGVLVIGVNNYLESKE